MTNDTMNLQALVGKSPDADFPRDMIGFVTTWLMKLEVDGLTGVAYDENDADRLAQRWLPGSRLETRAGTVELRIPKLRKGSYFPGFLEPRRLAAACSAASLTPSPKGHASFASATRRSVSRTVLFTTPTASILPARACVNEALPHSTLDLNDVTREL